MASALSRSTIRENPTYLSGFGLDIDWKPFYFVDDLPPTRSCQLCGVVAQRTFFLECSHSFCEMCYEEIARQGHTCPLHHDGNFDESSVRDHVFKKRQLMKHNVRCQNWMFGCDFVGDIPATGAHFVNQCCFHVVMCRKCGGNVLRSRILRHYLDDCQVAISPDEGRGVQRLDIIEVSKNIDRNLTLLSDSHVLLQDKINTLADQGTSTAASTKAIAELIAAYDQDRMKTHEPVNVRGMFEKLEECISELARQNEEQFSHLNGENGALKTIHQKVDSLRTSINSIGKQAQSVLAVKQDLSWLKKSISGLYLSVKSKRSVRYWYFNSLKELKTRVKEVGFAERVSDKFVLDEYGTYLRLSMWVLSDKIQLQTGLYLTEGPNDELIAWPFRRSFTLSLVHPAEETKNMTHVVAAEDIFKIASVRPPISGGSLLGSVRWDMQDIENNGFVVEDSFAVQVELL